MLAVTDEAITTIRQLTDSSQAPQGAGLRIAANPADGSLTVGLAAAPAQGDETVSRSGTSVFLDPDAATLLSDKTLDATSDEAGRVQFILINGESS